MGIDEDILDRQKRIGNWQQEPISKSNVLVVGAGALGNEVVKSLLQLGVEKITLIDYDIVVNANLNRCVFFSLDDAKNKRLKAQVVSEKGMELFASAKIVPIIKKVEELEEDFFSKFDVAFSCLDNLNARLHLNANCYGKTPLIDGGTTGFLGKVQVVGKESSCIECAISKRDYKHLWEKYSCVGEVLDFIDPKMPAISTTNSIIAALQVNEFLKLRMDSLVKENNLVGKYLLYDGRRNEFKIFAVEKRKDCPVH
ncbi:ThiF family adenylyltransferase [Candidatus Micrarchaeota archaeon]|nr:ThiF family adenylyltransferase [Candidatus Micrarchaeota archaeon]